MKRARPLSLLALVVALPLVVALSWSAPAAAKTVHRSRYTYAQTYGSALRLIKIDLDFEITESNPEWGYFLFSYASTESGKRKSRGSAQFVKVDGLVRISLQIARMPSYHEQLIVEKLKRKLYAEHGDPPRPSAPPNENDRKNDDKRADSNKDAPPK